MYKTLSAVSLALAVCVSLFSTPSHAAVVANMIESGGDVRIEVSGSLDLSGWSVSSPGATFDNFLTETGSAAITAVLNGTYDQWSAPDGTLTLFGTQPSIAVNKTPVLGSNGAWGFSLDNAGSDDFVVPPGFTGGAIPAGTFIVSAMSFADIGVSTGDSWGANLGNGDSITFNAIAIPEPSSFILVAGVVMLLSRRRVRLTATTNLDD